jgi:hypothetical protein
MAMQQILEEDRRLVILRSMLDAGGSANDSILQTSLNGYGHRVSRDMVKTQMYWLSEQGLITIETLGSCMIAKLTSHGQDVAEGLSVCPGVKKPRVGV